MNMKNRTGKLVRFWFMSILDFRCRTASHRDTGGGWLTANLLRFVTHKSLRANEEPPLMLRYRDILHGLIFNGLYKPAMVGSFCWEPNTVGSQTLHRLSIICPELDCVQCPRRKGISLSAESDPMSAGHLDSCLWTLPALFKKGLDPKTQSRRRVAGANYRA